MTDLSMPTSVVTSLGPVKSDTIKVAEEVATAAAKAGYTPYYVWAAGPTGDHLHGIAVDFMVYDLGGGVQSPGPERPAMGRWIADYVWTNRKRLGVRYEIFSRRIRSTTGTPPNVWLPYNGDDPHTNHVHVSRLADAPAYEPPAAVRPPDGSRPHYNGWDWPSKGWAHVDVKGDDYPWLNGHWKASVKSKLKVPRRKDGFNLYYVGKPQYHGGHYWVKTRFGTWYQIANDLVLGKKVK